MHTATDPRRDAVTPASEPSTTAASDEEPAFGCSEPFTIGIEEELLVVRDADHSLDPRAAELRSLLGHKAP
jgi:hypothetical protein